MIRWICVPGSHSILRETEWETLVVVGIRLLQKWLDVELLGCNVLKEAVSIIILRNFCFFQKKELGGRMVLLWVPNRGCNSSSIQRSPL